MLFIQLTICRLAAIYINKIETLQKHVFRQDFRIHSIDLYRNVSEVILHEYLLCINMK